MDYNLEKFNFDSELLQKILQNNVLLYFVVLLLVLKIATSLILINIPQNIFFADITKSVLENSVNRTRQSIGEKPLVENAKLNQAAQMKAQNMVQNQYFNHTSPSGVSPWHWFLQAGYNYKYAGENLAIGFFDSQEVYNAWLNSPEHKANIVNPNYTEIGTAVLNGFGSNNSIVVVQEFASPLPVKTAATKINNAKPVVPAQQKIIPTTKTAEPAPIASTQTPAENANEKVLAQSTESQNYIKSSNGTGSNSLPSKLINSILYNYDSLLQNIIYGVSLIVTGILLALIFFNFKINFNKQLILRSILIIALLASSALINKELIVSFIPHQVVI